MRAKALHTRRKLQRAFKRNLCKEEVDVLQEQHVTSQRDLKKAIKVTKAECWKNFLNTIDNDPWGRPYKAVLKVLRGKRPPVSLEKESALNIINGLFKTGKPPQRLSKYPREGFGPIDSPPVNTPEVHKVVEKLKEKTPGLNWVPAAAIKYMLRKEPEIVTNILRTCLDKGVFPPESKWVRLFLIPKKAAKPGWRPICSFSNWAKVLETIIKIRITTSTCVADNQFGLRKGGAL